MSRTHWTRKDIGRCGGHGDRILAATNDPGERWYWRELTPLRGFYDFDFRPKPGVVRFMDVLLALQAGRVREDHVLIEPHVKRSFSADNKDYGFERWQAVVDATVGVRWLQCVAPGTKALCGVDVLRTSTFEHAVAALSVASGIVTTPGGLHHAAAALGKPAVVVWGAYAPPSVLGYSSHLNLEHRDPEGLGWRMNHPACRAALDAISVEAVAQAVEDEFCGVAA